MATPLFLPREFWLLKIDSICKSDNVLHSHENTPSICHKTENPVQIKLFYPFNCLSISSQQIFCWDPLSTASRHSRSDSEMNVHQWQWVYSTIEKEEFLQWDGTLRTASLPFHACTMDMQLLSKAIPHCESVAHPEHTTGNAGIACASGLNIHCC